MLVQELPKSHGMTTVFKDYATITIKQPYVVVLCYYTLSTHGYQKKKTGGIRALCMPKASFCTSFSLQFSPSLLFALIFENNFLVKESCYIEDAKK